MVESGAEYLDTVPTDFPIDEAGNHGEIITVRDADGEERDIWPDGVIW